MLIKNGNAVYLHGVKKCDIRVSCNKIAETGENLPLAKNEEIIDASGKFVTAGFVDIHTHGGYGADFMDRNEDAFEKALSFHLDNGTTTVVPSSCTAPKEEIIEFLRFAKKYIEKGIKNAAFTPR